jgi:hypothetical protein
VVHAAGDRSWISFWNADRDHEGRGDQQEHAIRKLKPILLKLIREERYKRMEISSRISKLSVSSILLLGVSSAALAQNTPGFNNKIPEVIMTPDTVDTRIGTMNFFDGMPDAATVQKAYDNLDFMRGVEVFLVPHRQHGHRLCLGDAGSEAGRGHRR